MFWRQHDQLFYFDSVFVISYVNFIYIRSSMCGYIIETPVSDRIS